MFGRPIVAFLLVTALISACSGDGDGALGRVCHDLGATADAYRSLRAHQKSSDFLARAQGIARRLDRLSPEAARAGDGYLASAVEQARREYDAALAAYRSGAAAPAGELRRRQLAFGFSLTEARLECSHPSGRHPGTASSVATSR